MSPKAKSKAPAKKVEKKSAAPVAKAGKAPVKAAAAGKGAAKAAAAAVAAPAAPLPEGVDPDEAEEAADAASAAGSGGDGNAAAMAAAGTGEMSASFKNFRHHPDMENFYRFIFENDLRHEALAIMQTMMIEKREKRLAKLAGKGSAHAK